MRDLAAAPSRFMSRVCKKLFAPVTRVDTDAPIVALTFDDGPDPYWTPRVLEVLDRHRAQATFFMVGKWAGAWPELVASVARRGHAIGNHSWDHAALTMISSRERKRQLVECQHALEPYGIPLLRPPYGQMNLVAALDARRLGFAVVKWNVDVGDWWKDDPSAMADELITRVRPGSIVLLHDVLRQHPSDESTPVLRYPPYVDRGAMLIALDAFLADARERLSFVTLSELLRRSAMYHRGW
jgi:peptidoglycan-N-acetylglucosamine deacetylase